GLLPAHCARPFADLRARRHRQSRAWRLLCHRRLPRGRSGGPRPPFPRRGRRAGGRGGLPGGHPAAPFSPPLPPPPPSPPPPFPSPAAPPPLGSPRGYRRGSPFCVRPPPPPFPPPPATARTFPHRRFLLPVVPPLYTCRGGRGGDRHMVHGLSHCLRPRGAR